MAKWADYGICAVRFNARHTHIDQVQLRKDNGESLGPVETHARQVIVNSIRNKVTFVTIVLKGTQWYRGQPVFIVRINGEDYIKTVDNRTTVDNLDDLPEF